MFGGKSGGADRVQEDVQLRRVDVVVPGEVEEAEDGEHLRKSAEIQEACWSEDLGLNIPRSACRCIKCVLSTW